MTLPTLAFLSSSQDNGRHGTKGFGQVIQSHIPQPSLQEGSTIDNILRQYQNWDIESYASPNRPVAAFDRKSWSTLNLCTECFWLSALRVEASIFVSVTLQENRGLIPWVKRSFPVS
jgi:hypothetical protein